MSSTSIGNSEQAVSRLNLSWSVILEPDDFRPSSPLSWKDGEATVEAICLICNQAFKNLNSLNYHLFCIEDDLSSRK